MRDDRASPAPRETRVAADEEDRARIWKGRKSRVLGGRPAQPGLHRPGRRRPARAGWARRWPRSRRCRAQHGIRVANVFHAGDGNLHPLILYDGREAGAHDRAEVLAAEILRLCIRLGGSITGEHGVGLEKRAVPRRDVHARPTSTACGACAWRWIRTEMANRGQEAGGRRRGAAASHGLHPLERAGVISRA